MNTRKEETPLAQVLVTNEFLGVLLEDFPGITPTWDVDFRIELQLDTDPISKALYRMAPAELKELKTQLQELLDKGWLDALVHCELWMELNKRTLKNK